MVNTLSKDDQWAFFFPYLYSNYDFQVGEITFSVISRSMISEYPLISAVQDKMSLYKDSTGQPISACLAVGLQRDEQFSNVENAKLALMYTCLDWSVYTHNFFYADHFHWDFVGVNQGSGTVLLQERGKFLVGRPEDIRRNLPGGLGPICIRGSDETLLQNAERLYFRIKEDVRLKSSLVWFCKSFRWLMDEDDRLLALITAFESFMGISKEVKRKAGSIKGPIGDKLMDLLVHNKELKDWFGSAYDRRNDLAHEGRLSAERLIYKDPIDNKLVRPHEEIAQVVFSALIRTVVIDDEDSLPTDFESAVKKVITSHAVISPLMSNRRKLEEAIAILKSVDPSVQNLLDAMEKLDMVSTIDRSLSAEDCVHYMQELEEIIEKSKYRQYHGMSDLINQSINLALINVEFFSLRTKQ